MEKTTRQLLGERLLLRRRHLSLSQQALAQRCGFPYQVISGLERERQSITAERLKVLALALGVSADYLLGMAEESASETAREAEPAPGELVGA